MLGSATKRALSASAFPTHNVWPARKKVKSYRTSSVWTNVPPAVSTTPCRWLINANTVTQNAPAVQGPPPTSALNATRVSLYNSPRAPSAV